MIKGGVKMRSSKKKKFIGNTIIYFLLITGLIVMLMPFVWMLSTSFKELSDTFTTRIDLIPDKVMWSNYVDVWKLLPFGRFYLNSFIVSVTVMLLQLFFCSMAAYAFARLQWPGRDKVFLLYLAAMMIPGQVILIPNFLIIKLLNGINTYWGVILPQLFSVFGTFLLRQFFMTIPSSLEEAAIIDGCGHFKIYSSIILPLSKPGLSALGVFAFMFSWNNFLWPLVVLNRETMFTLPLGILSFQGQYSTNWPLMMAAACQAMLPILIIYAFGQKYIIESISMTGLANA